MANSTPIGRYTVIRPSLHRRISSDAFAALPPSHPMVALLELDVTEAETAIAARQAQGERLSLFAFAVHCIAVAMAEHPELNTVRHGAKLVRFEDVDVSVPVEVDEGTERMPRDVVVRRAQDLPVAEVYRQMVEARVAHRASGSLGAEDRWNRRLVRLVGWLPRVLRVWVIRRLIADAFRVKATAGTTLVTSVGKFATFPGAGFTFTTGPRAATFVVGSAVPRPWVHDGALAVRRILFLSVMVDHDLLDGAEAARFATRLKALLESAHGL